MKKLVFAIKKKFFFTVMRIFNKQHLGCVYTWAYMKCMSLYMKEDPVAGYWIFAEDYFAVKAA